QEMKNLILQNARSSWGGRRKPPHAFTKQGVAMLSSVLRSKRAVLVNVEIMRTFVRFRQMLATHADLARKLDQMERKYNHQFKLVFDAIRQLMVPTRAQAPPLRFPPTPGTGCRITAFFPAFLLYSQIADGHCT